MVQGHVVRFFCNLEAYNFATATIAISLGYHDFTMYSDMTISA
jgi:hypothetical protein